MPMHQSIGLAQAPQPIPSTEVWGLAIEIFLKLACKYVHIFVHL